MSTTHELPTPRTLLASLLTTLSALPSPPQAHSKPEENALKSLPATHKALFASLHVLLPQSILLPALDLLDRGLVTRLVVVPKVEIPEQVCIFPSKTLHI